MSSPLNNPENRTRGNAKSQAEIEAEKEDIVDMLNKDIPKTEMAEKLSVSRSTIHRRLKDLKVQYEENNTEAFAALRDAHYKVLELIEQKLIDGLDPKVTAEWRAIRKDMSAFHGLDAPSKHITARVDSGLSVRDLDLKKATSGLTEVQFEELCVIAAAMPRAKVIPVLSADWLPPVKKELDQ